VQRYATVTILAEDERAGNLLRRYAERALAVTRRRLVTVAAPPGQGDAKKWMLERYATEVQVYRRGLSHRGLIVHLDLDTDSIAKRTQQLADVLKMHGLSPRDPNERIAHVLTGRHVETWIAALTSQMTTPDNKPLDEQFDCKRRHFPNDPDRLIKRSVDELYRLTRPNATIVAPLPSLNAAVAELRQLERI
jgi:hypothetical protein